MERVSGVMASSGVVMESHVEDVQVRDRGRGWLLFPLRLGSCQISVASRRISTHLGQLGGFYFGCMRLRRFQRRISR